LIGNYSGFKEFHVGGDLLVIYSIAEDILRLTRIGTHSQLLDNSIHKRPAGENLKSDGLERLDAGNK
jgi:hypothetical protein